MDRKPFLTGCILPFLIFAIVPSLQGQHFEAEVIEVQQGDLLTVRHHGEAVELVLYGVECPHPANLMARKRVSSPREWSFTERLQFRSSNEQTKEES